MKIVEDNQLHSEKIETTLWNHEEESFLTHRIYNEMLDQPVVEVDELTQLRMNIEMVSELSSRLSFLTREIRYLLKL